MQHISRHKRFFAFGCSFTEYHWPTWADILGQECEYFENWGKRGGGNHYIFNSLFECHQRNRITPDDLVIIMWTFSVREDRFVRGEWLTPGNIYQHRLYDEKFTERWSDSTGYFLTTCNYITAAQSLLNSVGCNYHFLSVVDLRQEPVYTQTDRPGPSKQDIVGVYDDLLATFKPSVHRIIYNYDWDQPVYGKLARYKVQYLNGKKNTDFHSTPAQHLHYLTTVFPELQLQSSTHDFVNHWDRAVLDPTPSEVTQLETHTLYQTRKPIRFGF